MVQMNVRLEFYKDILNSGLKGWSEIIGHIGDEPDPNSFPGQAAEYLRTTHPSWEPRAPFDTGQDARIFFDYGLGYIRAVQGMIGHVQLFPAICPIMRAAYETFGRGLWLIDPDPTLTHEARMARFLMERLYAANRRKWDCGSIGDKQGQKDARVARNKMEALIKEWFPNSSIPRWSNPGEHPDWVVEGQEYPNLSGAVNRFGAFLMGDVALKAKGLGDH